MKKIILVLVTIVIIALVLIGWIWYKNYGYWDFNYYILHKGPPPNYCDPGPCPSSAPASAATKYDQCVKQGGELSTVGLNVYCNLGAKTFSAPLQIPPGEKQCGDVLCKQINGQWVPIDN